MRGEKGERVRRERLFYLLLGLEVVEQDAAFLRLLAPVAYDHAGAVDDFASVAFAVENACFLGVRKKYSK